MGLAALGACSAVTVAGGCPATWHQAARGANLLAPGAAVAIREVIEEHEAEHRAATGHGVPQRQGIGVRRLGRVDDGEFALTQQRIVGGEARQIACDTFVHDGIGTALGNPCAVGFVGALFAHGRPGTGYAGSARARGVRHGCGPEAYGA